MSDKDKIALSELSKEEKIKVIRTIREDILPKEPYQQDILLRELGEKINCRFWGLKQQLKKEIERKKNKEKEEVLKEAELKAKKTFDRQLQTQKYLKEQPYLYDTHRIWWLWSDENFKWVQVDEVDILNMLKNSIGGLDITTPSQRQTLINELKQKGRKNFDEIKEFKGSWIQFEDTIIDFITGERIKATPEYFAVNPIKWKLGSSEDTPLLDKLFRDWVYTEGLQDESYIETLYEIIAYCLASTSFLQRIIVFVGGGSNGKSTFEKVIEKFIGFENIASTEMDMLSENRFETYKLYKKLVVFIGEVDKSLFKKTSVIKRLSGEDLMRIEKKRIDSFDTRLYSKPIISCNKLPETTDTTTGFFRRWLIVDFFNIFKKQKDIINTIPDTEFENLAFKSIGILRKLKERGSFTNEGSFEERERKYREHSSPIDSYLLEKCNFDEAGQIDYSDFYSDYKEWLKSNNFKIPTRREILVSIENHKRLSKKKVKYNTDEGKESSKNIIKGVVWKDNIEEEE